VQNLNIQAQIQNQFGEAITFNPATGIPGEIDFLNQSNTITPELGGVIKPNGYNNDGYGLYDGFGNKIVDIHHSQISLPQQAAGSGLHQCLHTDDNGIVTGTGSDCGSGGGGGVPSVNGVTTAVTIAAGAGIAVSTVGSTVSIASTGGGGGSPAAPDYSIQASNVGQTAFISDPTILIDTTNHAIDVGTLGTYKVTIAPQGTMTANWTFDTTSPATALASLGGGGGGLSGMTAGQIPVASSASAVTSSKALAGSGTGITTGPTATTTNDCVIFSNTMGQIADSGSPCGGGGGGGLASGAALVAPVVGFGTNSGWTNYSSFTYIRNFNLMNTSSTWKLGFFMPVGGVTGGIVILRTLPGSLTVIDSTAVTVGGSSTPTFASNTFTYSDEITLPLDTSHDFYVVTYFTSDGANSSATSFNSCLGGSAAGLSSGNHLGDTTAPGVIGQISCVVVGAYEY
jgi:hypothetical protein